MDYRRLLEKYVALVIEASGGDDYLSEIREGQLFDVWIGGYTEHVKDPPTFVNEELAELEEISKRVRMDSSQAGNPFYTDGEAE